MQLAANQHWVALFHAHVPGASISRDAIERVFGLADRYHLTYLGYDELDAGPPRGGVAFAFDDNATDAWLSVRDIIAEHHARVTFFVTRWATMTEQDHANVHLLFKDGHDIEPHSVTHIHADQYVADHGLQAYVDDEVLPSITALNAEGFPSTTYAYPFGIHSTAMDDAILPYVKRLRVSPGGCPY